MGSTVASSIITKLHELDKDDRASVVSFYEKVIKVKADVAAILYV
jgi:predicted aconitase with swiveling domain